MQQSSDAFGQTFALHPFPDFCKVFFLQQGFEQLQLFRLGFVEKKGNRGNRCRFNDVLPFRTGKDHYSRFPEDAGRVGSQFHGGIGEKTGLGNFNKIMSYQIIFFGDEPLHIVDPFGNIVEGAFEGCFNIHRFLAGKGLPYEVNEQTCLQSKMVIINLLDKGIMQVGTDKLFCLPEKELSGDFFF